MSLALVSIKNITFVPNDEFLPLKYVEPYERNFPEVRIDRNNQEELVAEYHIVSPGGIQFPPNEKLLKKIHQVVETYYHDQLKNVNLDEHKSLRERPKTVHKEFLCMPSRTDTISWTKRACLLDKSNHLQMIQLPYCWGSPISKWYEIATRHSHFLLTAIQNLQKEGVRLFPSGLTFQKILGTLVEKESVSKIDSSRVETFASNIETGITLGSYDKNTRETRSVSQSLILANYHRQKGGGLSSLNALASLSSAKEYSNGKPLGELIDLKEFFRSECFKEIEASDLKKYDIDDELIDALKAVRLEGTQQPEESNTRT